MDGTIKQLDRLNGPTYSLCANSFTLLLLRDLKALYSIDRA